MLRLMAASFAILIIVAGSAAGETKKKAPPPPDYQKFVPVKQLAAFPRDVTCLAWSPDGKTVAGAGASYELWIWSVETGEVVAKLEDDKIGEIKSLDFSRDGKLLAAGGNGSIAEIWSVKEKKLLNRIETQAGGSVDSVVFSPDGTKIITTGNEIGLWLVSNGALGYKIYDAGSTITWSRDGRMIIEAGYRGFCTIETATGKKLFESGRKVDGAKYVAFSPDEKRVALTIIQRDVEPKIILCHPTTGLFQKELKGHPTCGGKIEFSPDGKSLLAAFQDKLAVWDVEAGRPIEIRSSGGEPGKVIRAVRFSPDGRSIAIARTGSPVRILAEDMSSQEAVNR
jgi:WD40 repeat protein